MGVLTFFRKLAADPTANTIVIAAVSLIPLLGMVGGAIDASRFYMTETRLQAACDAGALAARRAMDDGEFTAEIEAQGDNFFEQNFEDDMFGIEDLEHDYNGTDDGEVVGTASGTLPTSLMQIFGYEEFEVSVTCTADINISNTDIMFVVDVTASMNCNPDNPNGGNCNNVEEPNAKIKGLRTAVITFYETVEEATSERAQVRYGMVPYASNINVGGLIKTANPSWLATSHTYQSREANFTLVPGEYEVVSRTITSLTMTSRESSNYATDRQDHFGGTSAECTARKPADRLEFNDELGQFNQQSQTEVGDTRTTVYNDRDEDLIFYEGFTSYRSSDKRCRYGWRLYNATGDALWTLVEEKGEDVEVFANWTYKPVTFDLSSLYDDNQMTLPLGSNGTDRTVIWDGCIEEAETVAQASFNPLPSGAFDLNINLVPSSDQQKWKPVLDDVVYKRETDNNTVNTLNEITQTTDEPRPGYECPASAFRLAALENTDTLGGGTTPTTKGDLQAYVNALRGRGSTYHDIGMIWGARLISPRGIFEDDNFSAPNGDAISRHIVFMTDGMLAPNVETYGTYGIEWWDRRVTGDANNASTRHAERFQAACRAARQENISVWVVAFGTELTQNLIDCATPGRAFTATDSEALEEAFTEIAQKIAALRLTN
jgi:hypothetical protein